MLILLEHLPHTTNSRPLEHRQYCVQTSLFRLIHRFIASMRITLEWSLPIVEPDELFVSKFLGDFDHFHVSILMYLQLG